MDYQSEAARATVTKTSLIQDWLAARARIHTDLVLKLHHWQQLPWRICGLAHRLEWQVQSTAKTILILWALIPQPAGAKHMMARRFLDPEWRGLNNDGDPSDPPLRPFVEDLAAGQEVAVC
jgi:hypothetical protein